jgi:hypothetical protein
MHKSIAVYISVHPLAAVLEISLKTKAYVEFHLDLVTEVLEGFHHSRHGDHGRPGPSALSCLSDDGDSFLVEPANQPAFSFSLLLSFSFSFFFLFLVSAFSTSLTGKTRDSRLARLHRSPNR